MRRRRGAPTVFEPYKAAKEITDVLRQRTFYAMVDIRFGLEDVIDYCVAPGTKDLLRRAYAIAGQDNRYWGGKGVVSVGLAPEPVYLSIDFKKAEMFSPNPENMGMGFGGSDAKGIKMAIEETTAIRDQFAKVHQVIDWMHEHKMTPGAARYYWPTILALLPHAHDVHKADGQRYRETPNVSEILDTMRETSAIVAAALMLPAVDTARNGGVVLTVAMNSFSLV